MGLHSIGEDSSTIAYHCHNKDCRYHNCSNWESWQKCAHHDTYEHVVVPADEMKQRLAGAVAPEILDKMTDTVLTQRTTAGRTDGETRVLSIDDPGIEWVDERHVALPVCECGTRMTLKVIFTDEELKAPNIQIAVRDAQNPTIITRLDTHPMVPRHQALADALTQRGKVYVAPEPAPVTPSLTAEQLQQVVEHLQTQGIVLRGV